MLGDFSLSHQKPRWLAQSWFANNSQPLSHGQKTIEDSAVLFSNQKLRFYDVCVTLEISSIDLYSHIFQVLPKCLTSSHCTSFFFFSQTSREKECWKMNGLSCLASFLRPVNHIQTVTRVSLNFHLRFQFSFRVFWILFPIRFFFVLVNVDLEAQVRALLVQAGRRPAGPAHEAQHLRGRGLHGQERITSSVRGAYRRRWWWLSNVLRTLETMNEKTGHQ